MAGHKEPASGDEVVAARDHLAQHAYPCFVSTLDLEDVTEIDNEVGQGGDTENKEVLRGVKGGRAIADAILLKDGGRGNVLGVVVEVGGPVENEGLHYKDEGVARGELETEASLDAAGNVVLDGVVEGGDLRTDPAFELVAVGELVLEGVGTVVKDGELVEVDSEERHFGWVWM